MQKKSLAIFLVSMLFLQSCNKIEYYPDKEYVPSPPKLLAHRGGGNSPYAENSLKAAEYGLNHADGIELDVQISKDETLWLSHGVDLSTCGGTDYNCYPEATDSMILRLDSCMGEEKTYTRLEEVFSLVASEFKGKYISLDVKPWIPCGISSSNVLSIMKLAGDEIIRLTKKYKLGSYVIVSSETADFLEHVRHNSTDVACFLTAYKDYGEAASLALDEDLSGISFDFKADKDIPAALIDLAHQKGLRVLFWTFDEKDLLQKALALDPDFVITEVLEDQKNEPNVKSH